MLLELSIILVLAMHLMCVNVASAGPLVCMWLDWRGNRGDMLASRVGCHLCWRSLQLLLAGAALGLLLGWLHWDATYRDVLARFPSKIFFGIWELVFSLVLILATALLWKYAPQSGLARRVRAVLLFLTGTNLLYHFPFLFAIISRVHRGQAAPDGVVDASVFRALMLEDSVFAQAVHFGFASFAVVGIGLIGHALWRHRASAPPALASAVAADQAGAEHVATAELRGGASGGSEQPPTHVERPESGSEANDDRPVDAEDQDELGPEVRRIAIWGARLALVATLCQLPVGIWLVVSLAPDAQQQVMGADLIATGLLGLSIFLSLGLLHHLATVAFGAPRRRSMLAAVVVTAVLVTVMTGVLQRL